MHRFDYKTLLEKTLSHSLDYLSQAETAPIGARSSLEEIRKRIQKPLPQGPSDPEKVINALVSDVNGGLTYSTGGRFFGWVIGGTLPAALAADWLTTVWDQNAGMHAVAPAASIVEETCGSWLLELLGLPPDSSFALVTGCQMAHVTCLASARNELLRLQEWDVETRGLYDAPGIRIISSGHRHGSIERAFRLLGMGLNNILDLPIEDDGALCPKKFADVLSENTEAPTIVLLQAGDLNTGRFDNFSKLVPIARSYGAWVHVDAAFGLWVATNDQYKHLVEGIELADSWAVDGHKWLNVPYDCGYALIANRSAHYRSFGHKADYLVHSKDARDPIDWNPEYSRRARGFATYSAIASLGRSGIGEIIANCCRHAKAIVEGAAKLSNVEVLAYPIINQGLLRFLDDRKDATEEDHNRLTDAVTQRIVHSGEAYFACTTWKGARAMRVSVSDHCTSDNDVSRVLKVIKSSLSETRGHK